MPNEHSYICICPITQEHELQKKVCHLAKEYKESKLRECAEQRLDRCVSIDNKSLYITQFPVHLCKQTVLHHLYIPIKLSTGHISYAF